MSQFWEIFLNPKPISLDTRGSGWDGIKGDQLELYGHYTHLDLAYQSRGSHDADPLVVSKPPDQDIYVY